METTTKSHGRNALKLYFLLTTLVGVIWTLVSFGILLYTVGKQVIITNDEYILAERYYEMDMCSSNSLAKPVSVNSNAMKFPTEAEMTTCKEEKKAQLILGRKAIFKTDTLNGSIRGILFLILLLTHYPRFMRLNKKD